MSIKLSEAQDVREFPPKYILFRQGSAGGDLYFIKKGSVELLVQEQKHGSEAVVAIVHAPAVLGTMTLLEKEVRSATARCLTAVHAVVVTQAQREKMMQEVPQWLHVLLKDLSANLRNLNEKYVQIKTKHDVLEKRIQLEESKK